VYLNANERVGLVLSGGGARAEYEVGVLKAIYSGKCPAAGAFNAAVIASRLPGQFPAPIDYLESEARRKTSPFGTIFLRFSV